MPRSGDRGVFVDGPSAIEVVGQYLYVDEDFGRVLRIIDLQNRRSRQVPLPAGGTIIDIERDEAAVVVRDLNKAWRLDGTQQLVEVPRRDDRTLRELLQARLPASPPARVLDISRAASGDVYFTTSSEYAFGRRIWHLAPTGDLRTVVGPWSPVVDDPRQRGARWYPKALGSPVLDGRGLLWFLDRGRHMILKVELASGVVSFVHGGTIDTDPADPYGLQSAGEYVDLAVDDEGAVYAADHGGQRIVRLAPATHRPATVATVGGKREHGISDGWGEVAEPEDIVCMEDGRLGTAAIKVVDGQGGVIPGAQLYLLGAGGVERTMSADATGTIELADLPSRPIRVAVFLPGFEPAVAEFRASEGCTSLVRLVLKIGATRSHRMF
jgi:sugar lactone lactonase YvrE